MIISKSTLRRVLLLLFIIKGLISFGQSSTYSTTLDFNGSASFITIPEGNNDLLFSSDKFTLEAWIKIENAPPSGSSGSPSDNNRTAPNIDYIFAKKNNWSLYVINIGGSLYLEGRFRRDIIGNWPDVRSSTTLSTDTWYHVAFTNSKSDDRIRIYINGNLDNQEFWTQGGYGLTSTPLAIGIGANVTPDINNHIILNWSCSDVDGDLQEFEVYLDENDGSTLNTSIKYEQQDSNLEVELANNSTYFWKVIAIDANGNESNSGVYTFRTN